MIDDVLSDEKELGAMVETTVYKHIVSFYQGSTAQLGYFRKAKNIYIYWERQRRTDKTEKCNSVLVCK